MTSPDELQAMDGANKEWVEARKNQSFQTARSSRPLGVRGRNKERVNG